MPFLAFFAGPLGRFALYAGLAAVLVAGGFWIVHEHDGRVLAEQAAVEAAAVAQQQVADAQRAAAAATEEARAAVDRANRVATIKTEIARAPVSTSCATSPAVAAALDGLRQNARAGAGAAVNPGGVAGVPGSAGTARPPSR